MEPSSKSQPAFEVIEGGKKDPENTIIALRSDETPHRPERPLSPEEVEELRGSVDDLQH